MADRKTVAEGALTAPVLREAARDAGVDMPVTVRGQRAARRRARRAG